MATVLVRVPVALGAATVTVFARPDRRGWSRLAAAALEDALPPHLDEVVAVVAGTALWCLAVWVLLALLAGWVAALPGVCGAAGRLVVRLCVPRAFRALVLGGVAGGLLLGPAVAASASPVWPTSPPAVAATTPGPAWPTDTAPPAETAPPSSPPGAPSATPPTPPPTPPSTPATTGATSVVVTPGDSLWSIAADALREDGVTPTATRVAVAWPAWYAANRTAIGPDPGLLHPGTSLTAPTSTAPTSTAPTTDGNPM